MERRHHGGYTALLAFILIFCHSKMISKQYAVFCSLLIVITYCVYYQFACNSLIGEGPQVYKELDQLHLEHLSGKPLIPPFIDLDRPYAIAPAHNLSICCINKSMSTLMRGIACALYDTEEFMKRNRSIVENYVGRFCEKKNELHEMSAVEKKMDGREFTKIAAVRDPIDRFISFFADKCVYGAGWRPDDRCYNCANNVTCFLERQYSRFLEYAFSDNVSLEQTIEDTHCAPLSWNCEFGKYWKDYKILKFSADPKKNRKGGIEELSDILRDHKVANSTIDFIEKSALKGKTKHVTYNTGVHADLMRQIETDKTIREWLRKIYYYDYVLFDFDSTIIDN